MFARGESIRHPYRHEGSTSHDELLIELIITLTSKLFKRLQTFKTI